MPVFNRSLLLSCTISALACLSACTSPSNSKATATPENKVSISQFSATSESLVTNTLAFKALPPVNSDLIPEYTSDSLTQSSVVPEMTILTSEPILPVTPTVTMTANGVVERQINDYLQNRRSELRFWMERGATYFPMIEKIFAEEGVPDELKYVALGESSLRIRVKSPVGAAGMWQFMPATGRTSGLRVDDWVDERLDPEKATRAAAKHFKELYEVYNGNWHLVLAGYNCSFRCISRAVRKAGGTIENPPSYWEIYPYLPAETRGFIPKFIAASLIISNPGIYGIKTKKSSPPFNYDIVKISGNLSLEDAAMLVNSDLNTLSSLNPSLLRNTLPKSDTDYALKVPFHSYDSFVQAFPDFIASNTQASQEYEIVSGDSLGKIAHLFDVSIAELQSANGLSGHLIHPGQKLVIPTPESKANTSQITSISSTVRTFVDYNDAQYRPIKLGEGFELVKQPGFSDENQLMMVSLINPAENYSVLTPAVYKVRSGDTLGHISSRFSVSINDIKLWNNVRGSTIFPNQELVLHTLNTSAISSYQVQSGDNLGAIASRFGVTVNNLKRWNGLRNSLIFPGQNLQLN